MYLLDGNEITWQELVRIAQDEGYEEHDGLLTTSMAAMYLRSHGHTVENSPKVNKK